MMCTAYGGINLNNTFGLSWLHVSFLLHVKYTTSYYHIVHYTEWYMIIKDTKHSQALDSSFGQKRSPFYVRYGMVW